MRILICTQAVDKQDPVLGFLHIWIEELASHFASITVICLRKGQYDFPENVEVLSLGKENGTSRPARIFRFFRFVFSKRHNYESVLVHMNQEYILLGGWIWWILQKRIYLWRNHYAGTLLTDIAALFCTRVFCTSKFSYTAKYRKTVLMPVGVNTQLFRRIPDVERDGRKLLFLGRMAPSKKPDLLIG